MIFKSQSHGFTLVELMIVIAIIGILSVVLYPSITGYFERANDSRKITELRQIQLAITNHYTDNWTFSVKGWNYGYKWRNDDYTGQWWINLKNDPTGWYPELSVVEGLQNKGYIRNGAIKIFSGNQKKTIKDSRNTICKSPIGEIRYENLYLFFVNEATGEFAISAYLYYSNPENEEKVKNSFFGDRAKNPNNAWGSCTWYGMNYVVTQG